MCWQTDFVTLYRARLLSPRFQLSAKLSAAGISFIFPRESGIDLLIYLQQENIFVKQADLYVKYLENV